MNRFVLLIKYSAFIPLSLHLIYVLMCVPLGSGNEYLEGVEGSRLLSGPHTLVHFVLYV